ncbi:MAG: Tol-Pal system beta propeller repeat protein TolB [Acidiferrobacterales bacterium]|nr:Tol-Pal system beta propeller repeat protein TolB [Acidiferrobacterales bacterium]
MNKVENMTSPGHLKSKSFFFFVATVLVFLISRPASAVLTIEVNKGVDAGIPIAIVPFGLEGVSDLPHLPADIVESDLNSSGKFDPVSRETFLSQPTDLGSIQYKDWRLLKAEALVVGKIINLGNGQLEVRFRLVDVFRERQLTGQKFVIPENRIRKVSHQISDIIYQQLTGKRGAFDTKIAYITAQGKDPKRKFLLQVADADGFGPRTVLQSNEPILSPAWSPDGNWLAYVSFEKKSSNVYIQNVWSGERQLVSEYPGINSAPAWSPDGRSLALTLSKDGNPDIYVYNVDNNSLRRLTRHTAIDTEPDWAPDGRTIAFTSGRSGAPQIYRIPVAGGNAQRVTFDGKYNAGPSHSPDGKSLVLITDQGNGFRVGIYSQEERSVRELTDTRQDESPTFAPNGEMIIYATQKGGRSILAAVSTDGSVQQTLRFQQGSVREPAWSPFNRKL